MAELHPPTRRAVVATPVAISVAEWGPADAPPLALVHGGMDLVRTFDGVAPLLAAAGWRVVAWDQRGHGDSEHTDLYGWSADLRDGAAVLAAVGGGRPVPVVGHSKGAVLAIDLALGRPDLTAAVVAVDGFVRRRGWEGEPPAAATRWLDARRSGRGPRPGTPAQLAERRAAANPGVPMAFVDHLVATAAAPVEEAGGAEGGPADGTWQWKVDPAAAIAPPHAWTTAACLEALATLAVPFLGLRAGVDAAFAGQPDVDDIVRHLPPGGRLEVLDGLGHFAHTQDPELVVRHVLNFLGPPPAGP
jgi:pimeloyl-ACP methyl ester carboxylesterase